MSLALSADPEVSTMTTTDPETITEVILPGVVEPDGLVITSRALAAPGKGEALVRMLATGVSFAENSMRRNRYPGQPRFPFVLGYDLVGEVQAVGAGVDPALIGRHVAAVTKTGGWSSHLPIAARDLIAVPASLDAATVETVLLNGITAWQMLHRSARVSAGQTILVHGASGGVGSVLVQLARHAGVRVIGTGSERHHDRLRALGAEPLDYRDPELARRLTALAPGGFDAVFDNIGGASFTRSLRQLAPGGTLVAYGTAGQLEDSNNMILTFIGILSRFALWSAAPNRGRSATFYNFWAGVRARPRRFRTRLADDLAAVLRLVADGSVQTEIAARFPLTEASEALALADTRTTRGKIIIEP